MPLFLFHECLQHLSLISAYYLIMLSLPIAIPKCFLINIYLIILLLFLL